MNSGGEYRRAGKHFTFFYVGGRREGERGGENKKTEQGQRSRGLRIRVEHSKPRRKTGEKNSETNAFKCI